MRIAKLKLKNWQCYRGDQEIVLGPKVYAVVARLEDDPDRSNFVGKSAFLESIDFALWGRHRHRTEDAFITNGAPISEVELELDTGARIIRRRERGKRTTLHYFGPEVKAGAIGDEAQRIIGEVVGLGQDDFLATCYFQQRQMARLVLADPGERMGIVGGWLRLEPLERCEAKVRVEGNVLTDQERQLKGQLVGLDEMEKHALDGATPDALREALAGHADVLERRRGQHASIQDQIHKNSKLISVQGRALDFEQLVAEGKRLKDEVGKENGSKLHAVHEKTREVEQATGARARMARAQLEEKRTLSRGEFDGKCPVAGLQCPVAADINKDRKRGLKLYEEAQTAYALADAEYEVARDAENDAAVALGHHGRKVAKLEAMREQGARMQADVSLVNASQDPEDPQVLRLRLEDASRRLDEALMAERTLTARLEQLEGISRRRVALEKGLTELRARLAIYREAAVVFGKQGAQRRVAEGALGEIEAGANDMLRETGIDLEVGVRWSREGSGLSKACDACGSPFPASAKAKVCQRCGAARGPNLINKLEIELSDRSGAAEDLAGAAVQLSASAWLRNERGSTWATILLDEAFGQLDASHRRAFGIHLASMLGGRYAFEQGFIVAHSPDVLHSLPGRIEIVGSENGSTVRVVS